MSDQNYRPTVAAFGIGADDLHVSAAYDAGILGMKRVLDLSLSDMDEVVPRVAGPKVFVS